MFIRQYLILIRFKDSREWRSVPIRAATRQDPLVVGRVDLLPTGAGRAGILTCGVMR